MRTIKHLCFLIVAISFIACSKVENPNKYIEEVYNTIELTTFEYASGLELDFYSAKEATDKERPLIIVMHGGGFQGGDKTNKAELKFCREMARRGFAIASISYRLTRAGKGFDCKTTYDEKIETFREASFDLLAASNFLISKSSLLKFDANKIILLGSSAGAEAVLNTVYMRNSNMLKDLDYGQAHFAGVISLAGAMVSMDYFKENITPAILIHGEKDYIVPYNKAPHQACKEEAPGYLMLYGAEVIAKALKKEGESYMLLHDPEGNHGWAGWGYSLTEEIANFINEVVIKENKVQLTKQISR